MKKFGTGNAPFLAPNGNIPEGDSTELNRPTNQAFNAFYSEQKNLVEASGQALKNTVADDPQQMAKAAFIYATTAGSVACTGGNAKTLTLHSPLVAPSHVLLKDALFSFVCNSQTTDAVTISVAGISQPAAYPLVWNESPLSASVYLEPNVGYQIKYDQPNARFILMTPPKSYFDDMFNAFFDRLYRINGAPYFSLDPANPATYLGRGIWTAWGGGTHLSFAGTSDGVTLTAGVSGSHTHTITTDQMPDHYHGNGIGLDSSAADGGLAAFGVDTLDTPTDYSIVADTPDGIRQARTDSVGDGQAMPIRPRTTTLYGWIRTA